MKTIMFPNAKDHSKVSQIIKTIWSHKHSKHHSKHFSLKECKDLWLKITEIEEDQKLQDVVLSIHHSYMHTFANTNAIKIIENHQDKNFITLIAVQKNT
jgi:hypothetical protein